MIHQGIIKVRMSGTGHEKLYRLNDASPVQATPAKKITQQTSVIYPPSAPQIREKNPYSAQSYSMQQQPNPQQALMPGQMQQDTTPLFFENGQFRKARAVLDGWTIYPASQRWIPLFHWE